MAFSYFIVYLLQYRTTLNNFVVNGTDFVILTFVGIIYVINYELTNGYYS